MAGAFAYTALAINRNEPINSIYILVAALCTYAIGYRFYSKWIATRVLMLDDRRATPCEVHEDGKDYVKTNKWIVFGHHFAAISGPGPLVGPVLAAQFGYLPGTLWILIGVVLGGAVQDMVILFASVRRDGKSLATMVRDELNSLAGAIGLVGILAILTILLAVLALVVVNALAESPWGVFTVGATIPIAMFMGGYLRFIRAGKVMEVSIMGVILLLLAVWGGQFVYRDPELSKLFTLEAKPLAWAVILYGLAASVLPVWLLLAPRDYLSTFMKLGTIFALVLGVFIVLPNLQMPAISQFVDGSGLVVPGKLFPFCFITIACGAISGFHTLIASGITPKIITRESYVRSIGYGAMCLESLVAIMAMVAACAMDPGIYLSMNVKAPGADLPAVAAATKARVENSGFKVWQTDPVTKIGQAVPVKVSTETMDTLAKQVGEKTLYGRTGGAATLAVGMAQIFSKVTKGRWIDLWYHFAIMFEALFILTTVDAGTRVGRYLLQDVLGRVWKPLGDIKSTKSNLIASTLFVMGWGFFLIMGVLDPDGGIKALWPIFGIANQMLAAIALCLATTVILKSQLQPNKAGNPWFAMVTLIPLIWLLAVTLTAGGQKIFNADKRIGFLSAAHSLSEARPALEAKLADPQITSNPDALKAAQKALKDNRTQHFNNTVDATVTAGFIILVLIILALSIREWFFLITRRKLAQLQETEAVWLPNYAVAEGKPVQWLGIFAFLALAAREISGEAAIERAQKTGNDCACVAQTTHTCAPTISLLGSSSRANTKTAAEAYVEVAEKKYTGINRCC